MASCHRADAKLGEENPLRLPISHPSPNIPVTPPLFKHPLRTGALLQVNRRWRTAIAVRRSCTPPLPRLPGALAFLKGSPVENERLMHQMRCKFTPAPRRRVTCWQRDRRRALGYQGKFYRRRYGGCSASPHSLPAYSTFACAPTAR